MMEFLQDFLLESYNQTFYWVFLDYNSACAAQCKISQQEFEISEQELK